GKRIFYGLIAANMVTWVAFVVVILLTGCGATLPVVVASSYVAGQVSAAHMTDSIERKAP
ncbi:MAG: hypothetical protein QG586_392, partial [Pseudomonadota bacterium]|nr:hypothetical protein [Pseudomonadota bacterium]